jgi:hypothetical protein
MLILRLRFLWNIISDRTNKTKQGRLAWPLSSLPKLDVYDYCTHQKFYVIGFVGQEKLDKIVEISFLGFLSAQMSSKMFIWNWSCLFKKMSKILFYFQFKALLHFDKNCSKLVHFNEQKNILRLYKNCSLERFSTSVKNTALIFLIYNWIKNCDLFSSKNVQNFVQFWV